MAFQTNISGSIAIGQSQSDSIQLNEGTPVGLIITGSTVTGTAMTFLGSVDGTNFYPMYDNTGIEVNITTGPSSRMIALDTASFYDANFIKCRLGTSASPVNQATYSLPFKIVSKIL